MFHNCKDCSAVDARSVAQQIAFAPIVFQAARTLRDLNILEVIRKNSEQGVDVGSIASELKLSQYGVGVLLELGEASGLVYSEHGRFFLTKVGLFILKDSMTNINMNFVADICYDAVKYLPESISKGTPEGLKVFGDWDSLYEGLAATQDNRFDSWFEFDHYYSDYAFTEALNIVFAHPPRTLLDVGGNTGKWALRCLAHHPEVQICLVDLPGQAAKATENINQAGYGARFCTHPLNVLEPTAAFPPGQEVIWMSQFLDCFSPEEITDILSKAVAAMSANSTLYIMETFLDRQKFEAARFSLQCTSLYFTSVANGDSKMYHSAEMIACVERAGLRVVEEFDHLGLGHTLLKCVIASA